MNNAPKIGILAELETLLKRGLGFSTTRQEEIHAAGEKIAATKSSLAPEVPSEYIQSISATGTLTAYRKALDAFREKVLVPVTAIKSSLEQAKAAFDMAINRIDARVGLGEKRAANAEWRQQALQGPMREKANLETRLAAEKASLSALSLELYGTEQPHRPTLWQRIALFVGLTVVAVAEVPINKPVFEVFGEGEMLTIISAFGFGIVIALLADVAGKCAATSTKQNKKWLVTLGISLYDGWCMLRSRKLSFSVHGNHASSWCGTSSPNGGF